MYEWSKNLINKIEKANCLEINELRMVEVSLRAYEVHNQILDECIGSSDTNVFELEHKITPMHNREHFHN